MSELRKSKGEPFNRALEIAFNAACEAKALKQCKHESDGIRYSSTIRDLTFELKCKICEAFYR